MKSTRLLVATLAWTLLAASSAHAGFVTHSWTGTVLNLGGTGATDPLVTGLLGQTASYSYTFDDTTTDFSADPTYGSYFNAIQTYSFSVGGDTVGPGAVPVSSQVSVWNDNPTYQDRFSAFVSTTGASILGAPLGQINVSMRDTTGTAFASAFLPPVEPNPSLFNSDGWIQFFISTPSGQALVEARDLEVTNIATPVPVPPSHAIFLLALAGLALSRQREKTT